MSIRKKIIGAVAIVLFAAACFIVAFNYRADSARERDTLAQISKNTGMLREIENRREMWVEKFDAICDRLKRVEQLLEEQKNKR